MKYKALIEKMTLEQKASLMSGKDFWQTMDIPEHEIPSIFLSDGPSGIRKQMAEADHLGLNPSYPATCFPSSATIANSWDINLANQVGKALGEEAVDLKVNVLLGPGVNIKRNPLCGRNFEYYSEDPYLAGKMAANCVKGIQSNGISSCIKHFACNSQETRRMASDSIMDERTLREIYLTAFEIVVKEGKTKTIMSAYNKINGTYANESMHLLDEILRKEWGFNGVVVTDWGGDNVRADGLIAGNELEMPTTGGETNEDIIKAIKDGTLNESYLDAAVDRLLDLIFTTQEVYKGRDKDEKLSVSEEDRKRHHEIAQSAAEQSIVLLKNDGTLPLKKEKVAFIGDFVENFRYQGAGSSVVNPTKLEKALDYIDKYDYEYIGWEKGFDRFNKKKNQTKKALALATKAETVVMFLGLDEVTETEGMDRTNMKIPENQIELFNSVKNLGVKIVVVLVSGSAVELAPLQGANAILHACLSGQAGAKAILNVIAGVVNPSGKLSETFPVSYEDVPCVNYFPGKEYTAEYREGIFTGYRYYSSANVPVQYPFGFGLSYTTFEYSDISATDKSVSFTVKNTGKADGAEVSQVYIGLPDSKIIRPVKELKGFAKTFIKAGESAKVTVQLDDKAFRYFNVISNKWEIEPGKYSIMVGSNVEDIKLSVALEIAGTEAENPYTAPEFKPYFKADVKQIPDESFALLLGAPIPVGSFDKKKPLGYNDTIGQMAYCKGWFARFAYGCLNLFYKCCRAFGKYSTANLLQMSVFNAPFRSVARMTGGGINYPMLDGVLVIVNGNFFKGIGIVLKENSKKGKAAKAAKKAKKEAEEAKAASKPQDK